MTVDYKGHFLLGDHRYCYPLTVVDHVSRYLLACDAFPSNEGPHTRRAFERIFREYGLPRASLSDNGSPYTAKETRDFAAALNLVPCFTPVRSPESNGMSEAFVKTFKRDYVRVNPLPDALTTLRQIAGWFEDYNENHPHSGLRMRSPREFIRAQAQ